MDEADFEVRVSQLLETWRSAVADGKSDTLAHLKALGNEIISAHQKSPENSKLAEMVDAVSGLQEMLSDPDFDAMMRDALQNPSPPQPALFDAIETGDLDTIRAALDYSDVNATFGEFSKTALYHAVTDVEGVSLNVLHLLLDAGADPSKGLSDCNVLHGLGFARWTRDLAPDDLARFVLRCVELGADLEERTNKLQWTPLITAVSEWEPVATEALLLAGADIHARPGDTGACYSGASLLDIADGSDETVTVLRTYLNRR